MVIKGTHLELNEDNPMKKLYLIHQVQFPDFWVCSDYLLLKFFLVKGLLSDAQHPTKKLLEFQKERNVTHSTFFKKQSFKAGSEITEMIELAEELLKPLISICLMKHKNKQGEKLGKINK